jgi:hypothetical protein
MALSALLLCELQPLNKRTSVTHRIAMHGMKAEVRCAAVEVFALRRINRGDITFLLAGG